MKLKEIRERVKHDAPLIKQGFYPFDYKQVFKDRAYLLEFSDKLKSIADDIVNCSCITCGDRRECDFLNKYEALKKED